MKKKKISCIKIAVLGDSPTGKTSICGSFMGLDFRQETLATIGTDNLETRSTLKNGEEIKLYLLDTAGQERFRSMSLKTTRSAQGVVLVFDLTNRKSFENINVWLEQIKENLDNPCIVLFGNKNDRPKEEWRVTIEEAEEFAKKINLKFFETSAKTKFGINEGLSYIANETYDKIKKMIDNTSNYFQLNGIRNDNEYEYVNGCFGKKKRRKKKNKAK